MRVLSESSLVDRGSLNAVYYVQEIIVCKKMYEYQEIIKIPTSSIGSKPMKPSVLFQIETVNSFILQHTGKINLSSHKTHEGPAFT